MKLKFLLILLFSSKAFGYAEMIGHGYQSCKACHIDTAGGGPLTGYGHTAAEEVLAIWSNQKEGDTFYGYIDTSPFLLGGDFRFLYDHYEDDSRRVTQSFPMQQEISLAFDPAKNVTIVGSAGLYGPNAIEPEYRRYYGKLTLGQGIGVRGGRFMPAFGLLQPDHTKHVRELFGEGKESLNLEGSITREYFELFITRIAGSNSGIATSSRPVVVQRDNRNGFSGKLSLFLAKGLQIGASAASLSDDATNTETYVSYHAFAGNRRVWSFAEFQSWPNRETKFYGTIGAAIIRGLWTKIEVDTDGYKKPEVFGTIQVFPRPHFELLLSASEKQYLAITHIYL